MQIYLKFNSCFRLTDSWARDIEEALFAQNHFLLLFLRFAVVYNKDTALLTFITFLRRKIRKLRKRGSGKNNNSRADSTRNGRWTFGDAVKTQLTLQQRITLCTYNTNISRLMPFTQALLLCVTLAYTDFSGNSYSYCVQWHWHC